MFSTAEIRGRCVGGGDSGVIDRAARLARAFRARSLPVVLVNVSGMALGRTDAGVRKFSLPPDWTDLVPELEQQPSDVIITKQRWGAFLGTTLDDILRARHVTDRDGYRVERIFPRLGETAKTEDVLQLLK